jgi:ribonuclease III
MDIDLPALEKKIGIAFQDYSLLIRALTHRSYANENAERFLEDNERLEFLGDAVLDFVVGAYLYNRFPEMDEGELTSLRAALVRANTLAAFARQWELGHHLRLGLGESEGGGRSRTPILCATFEAVIGAIYLDQGLATAQGLVEGLIAPALVKIMAESLHKDAKSEFQVWAQARFNVTPHYAVVETAGPDHAKLFTVEVRVDDTVWGKGEGSSKQVAAMAAARAAMAEAEAHDDREML